MFCIVIGAKDIVSWHGVAGEFPARLGTWHINMNTETPVREQWTTHHIDPQFDNPRGSVKILAFTVGWR